MLSYMFIKELIKEMIIDDLLQSNETFDIALGIIALPVSICLAILLFMFKIVMIPFYILIGIIYLLVKVLQIIFKNKELS